jgi:hypothetical protein
MIYDRDDEEEEEEEEEEDDDHKQICVRDIIAASKKLHNLRIQTQFAEDGLKAMLRRVRSNRRFSPGENVRTVFLDKILPVVATALTHEIEDDAKTFDIAMNTMLTQFNLNIDSEVVPKVVRQSNRGMYD